MRYNVLIFDADHTLFDFHASEHNAFFLMLESMNIVPTNDLFSIFLTENKKVWHELEQGLITQEELKTKRFKNFINAASLTLNPQACSTSYMKHLANQSILYPNVLELIERLSREYTITILTNGLKEVQHKRIRNSLLKPFIKDVVISDEQGITKPDPLLFHHALKNIDHQTLDDVMIIGDSLTSDIQGGINASITTVWFNPTKKKNNTLIKPDHEIHQLEDLFSILNN